MLSRAGFAPLEPRITHAFRLTPIRSARRGPCSLHTDRGLRLRQPSADIPGPRGALRGVPEVRAAAAERRRPRLHGADAKAEAGPAQDIPVAAGGDQHVGLAGGSAGRSRARARGDERARLRSSCAAAVGTRSGVLQVGVDRPERHARARGSEPPRARRALDLQVPALCFGCSQACRGVARDSAAAFTGAREPDRQRARPLDHGHRRHGAAGDGSRRSREARGRWRLVGAEGRDRGGASGDGGLGDLARAAGAEEDRSFRYRRMRR